jgi:hypothetical protein
MTEHEGHEGYEGQDWLVDDASEPWEEFEVSLAAYLGTMRHLDDHLILETPDSGGSATAPYAQVDVVRPGVLRGELSGNTVLEDVHQLDRDGFRGVCRLGWEPPDPEQGFPNFSTEVDLDDAETLAQMIRIGLGEGFGVADPGLLSYRAWGPAADGVDALGLAATDEVPTDLADGPGQVVRSAVVPQSRDQLLEQVGEALAEVVGDEVERDEDDDFVLDDGHRVYVRVRGDEPTIETFARVVHEVRSRKGAAVELALLNRDVRWAKFYLADRSVYMMLTLPGSPYSAEHVRSLVPLFQRTLLQVRGDLALRTGGRVG